ncbi:MAG: transporter substrate-binding domain-containing protein [Neptuniibacter sp.]
MKKIINKSLMFLSLLSAPLLHAESIDHIKETGVLQVCANPEQKPFSWDSGRPEGFQIDVAKVLADKLEVELDVAWIFLKRHAKKTGCDMYVGVARLDGDTKYVKKSDPFARIEFKLVTAKGIKPVSNIKDLKGLTIGLSAGSIAAHALRDKGVEFAVSHRDEASRLDAVANGVIDGAIVTQVSAGWYEKTFGSQFNVYDAEKILKAKLNYDYSLGLRRSNQQSKAEFNQILAEMKADGSIEKVLDKYGI